MKYSREFQVGLSIILAGLIFFFGVRYFADQPLFGGTYTLHTRFADAGGLAPGNAVRVNGVKVGTVDDVELDAEQNAVRVSFNVERDVAVTEGSRASVSGLSFLGTSSMSIALGPPENPPLESGGFVPSSGTSDPIADLTARAPRLASRADSALLNANVALTATADMLARPDSDVRRTLQSVRSAADQMEQLLRTERGAVAETLENLHGFSSEVERFGATRSDSLARAVDRLNALLLRLDHSLDDVDVTTHRLDDILARIDRGEGTLGMLVNDPGLYLRIDSTTRNLNALITDFQENPRRYLRHLDLVRVF